MNFTDATVTLLLAITCLKISDHWPLTHPSVGALRFNL